MARLEQETDVELLREAVRLLEHENRKLSQQVLELTRQLAAAKGEDEQQQLRLRLAELERQLAGRNKLLFGDSSERRSRRKRKGKGKKKQTGHGPRPQPELPIVEQLYDLDEADRQCPACGGLLEPWEGQFEESEEVDVLERRFVLRKHRQRKYRCSCGGCIETAPGPVKLFPGARYSIDFAVEVAVGKYLDHLPLERQARMMRREGLAIDSQTLWDQLNRLARLLAPGYQALTSHVLSRDLIGVDETHWKLLGAKGKRQGDEPKRWQVWAAAVDDAVFYQIHDTRSTKAAEAMLRDYRGQVMCDGYSVYLSLAKQWPHLELRHCWAHVRREILEAEGQEPEQAGYALERIGKLYKIESRCRAGPEGDAERARLRDTESRAIIAELHDWALSVETLPKSPLGKAVAYMAKLWTGLTAFLDDPQIPLDNNGVERALRGVVLGRRNHHGSRSKRGTEVAALFYSLLESAKLAGVEPKEYLRRATRAAIDGSPIPLPHQLASGE
jgi:transposase